jgi:hypothetical protein
MDFPYLQIIIKKNYGDFSDYDIIYNLDMFIYKFSVLLALLYYSIVLAACGGGEVDLLVSSLGTYQVNAYINDYPLNEYSIIRQNDIIRPFFVSSVVNDPDVRGLTVFLQSSSGQVGGKKTRYTLVIPSPQEHFNNPETNPLVETPPVPKPEVITENPPVPDPGLISENSPISEPELITESPPIPEPITENPPVPIPEPIAESPPIPIPELITENPVEAEPEKVPESSLATEIPIEQEPETAANIPAEPEPSSPAVPNPEEIAKPQPILPDVPSKPKENTPEQVLEERVISVTRLDQDLPSFQITETLEIGEYFMVFQVFGDKDVLYTFERPVYFLGNAKFTFYDVQQYLPSLSSNTYFLPPGLNILLEAQIISDKQLDPYIIWYNGGKRISEGKVFEGANYLMWKVPEQTGFHLVKAVVFPFKPNQNSNVNGIAKELSLPVSSKSKSIAYFSNQADRFIHWYQFQNNLLDSKAPSDRRRRLGSVQNKAPQWLPSGGMYGLSVGPKDVFLLPDPSLTVSTGEQGSGYVLFRLFPLSDGTVFKAAFKTLDKTFFTPSDTLDMTLSLSKKKLILTLSLGELSYKETLDLESLETGRFITPSIHFGMKGDQFSAQVYLEESNMETKQITMNLPYALTGKGIWQFGAEVDNTNKSVAILNEVGIIFTTTPFSPEPAPLEQDIETTASEEIYEKQIAEQHNDLETT